MFQIGWAEQRSVLEYRFFNPTSRAASRPILNLTNVAIFQPDFGFRL